MSDARTAANTLRALELLGDSQHDFMNGGSEYSVIVDRAIEQCGAETVSVLLGGMRIGELPKPGDEGWNELLTSQRDHVARLETQGETE